MCYILKILIFLDIQIFFSPEVGGELLYNAVDGDDAEQGAQTDHSAWHDTFANASEER